MSEQWIFPEVTRHILHQWHLAGRPADLWPLTLYANNDTRPVEIAGVDELLRRTEGQRVVETVIELND